MTIKLGAHDLRHSSPQSDEVKTIKRNPIYLVLDGVLDTYNIGSLFRLADAIAAEKMYICGNVEYPPSSRIHKAAVGTEEWVPWEKRDNALAVLKELKEKGVQIITVEQDPMAISPSFLSAKIEFPCSIVVGNETTGVSKEVLKNSDLIVELPMFGVNKSFNVWGSGAIIAYRAIEALILKPYLRKRSKS